MIQFFVIFSVYQGFCDFCEQAGLGSVHKYLSFFHFISKFYNKKIAEIGKLSNYFN